MDSFEAMGALTTILLGAYGLMRSWRLARRFIG